MVVAKRPAQDDLRRLYKEIRGRPLEPQSYLRLAEALRRAGDDARSKLFTEIGLALGGEAEDAPAPKLLLSATDRAGLRHPALRNEAGELLGLCGLALCALYPAKGKAAGTDEPFRLDSGPEAPKVADALLASVRVLGLRASEPLLAEEPTPAFAVAQGEEVKLLIGKGALERPRPGGELRFFAGRALFTQSPDLLALRTLRKEQLLRALTLLGEAVKGKPGSAEAKRLKQLLAGKAFDRIKQLYGRVAPSLQVEPLAEGARHSANRAGLVVAGGVGAALEALRAKRAFPSELLELVRFAGSERYLKLRLRQLQVKTKK
jgi:hypothetical protein